jgi:hypothetical protein
LIYTVYKTTNCVNGCFYFGKHRTTNPNDRYLGSGTVILRAIKKYGRESFSKEVLYLFDTVEEANEKEIELIAGELENPKCYNLTVGGECGWEYVNRSGIVQESWEKNREARVGMIRKAVQDKWNEPEHRKTHGKANCSPEAKQRQSDGHKKQWTKYSQEDVESFAEKRRAFWESNPELNAEMRAKIRASKRVPLDDEALVATCVNRPELSYDEVGKMFGISGVTVSRRCKEAGVKRKAGSRPGKKRGVNKKHGRTLTSEERQAISSRMLGVPKSEETKRKISDTLKKKKGPE